MLGAEDAGATTSSYARASKLVFLRRYAAKLAYELELHGGERPLDAMPALYARLLGDAVGVDWPAATYLADVDEGYYAANYLRAWAFETHLRARCCASASGPSGSCSARRATACARCGAEGQRMDADELLGRRSTGERARLRRDGREVTSASATAGESVYRSLRSMRRARSCGSRGAARSRAGGAAQRA